jgi:hypothetical protein
MLAGSLRIRAGVVAAIAAGAAICGCGAASSTTSPSTRRTAGYKVLVGGLPLRTPGSSRLTSGQSPGVPSSGGKWWAMPSAGATFNRTAKVELLATGKTGVRFHLQWQEGCGGNRIGRRGVIGGSGGTGSLTLDTPALVLVKLPPPEGALASCYMATTVFLQARTFDAAEAVAPIVRVVHY